MGPYNVTGIVSQITTNHGYLSDMYLLFEYILSIFSFFFWVPTWIISRVFFQVSSRFMASIELSLWILSDPSFQQPKWIWQKNIVVSERFNKKWIFVWKLPNQFSKLVHVWRNPNNNITPGYLARPALRAKKPAVLKSPGRAICSLWTWAKSHILDGRLLPNH